MLAHDWTYTELLARLNAKGPSASMAPGGKPKYTMEDISGALAGIEYPIYCYARVKYCQDGSGYTVMQDEAKRKIRIHAVRKNWRGNPEYLDRIVEMALEDMIKPVHCKRCKGHGYLPKKQPNGLYELTEPCPMCKTYADRMPDSGEAAERCHPEMTAEAWRQRWKSRYKYVLSVIGEWDGIIETHLKHQLIDKRHTFD